MLRARQLSRGIHSMDIIFAAELNCCVCINVMPFKMRWFFIGVIDILLCLNLLRKSYITLHHEYGGLLSKKCIHMPKFVEVFSYLFDGFQQHHDFNIVVNTKQ